MGRDMDEGILGIIKIEPDFTGANPAQIDLSYLHEEWHVLLLSREVYQDYDVLI